MSDATTTDGGFRVGNLVETDDRPGFGEVTRLTELGNYCVRFADGTTGVYAGKRLTPAPVGATLGLCKPDHYAKLRDAGHEPWAVIRACLTPGEAVAYHRGTAIVYLMRAGLKHPTPDDDIRKAHAHLGEAARILDEEGQP